MKKRKVLAWLMMCIMLVLSIEGATAFAATSKTDGPKLNKTSITLKVGGTFKLVLKGATAKEFGSANSKIAKVSSAGKITAKKAGNTVINVIDSNNRAYKCTVKVTDAKKLSWPSKPVTINVLSYTDEVPALIQGYLLANPKCNVEINTTIIPTEYGKYANNLESALINNEADIYVVESAFAPQFISGEESKYAATYNQLGIDVNAEIKNSEIAEYAYESGTRAKDQEVVALPYASTAGCFIYRRDIAKDVWGTDAPATVQKKIGGGTGNWKKFMTAAEDCKEKGYAIVSSLEDIWRPVSGGATSGWVVNGKLNIDPKKEAFLDMAKKLYDNGYISNSTAWTVEWFADMHEKGNVLGYFGPAWLVNYTMAPNSDKTYGDWAVCQSPEGFFWGGSYIMASKSVLKDANKKAAVAKIIHWMTLDSTAKGLQFSIANGDAWSGTKDTVISNAVMKKVKGNIEFLGGQNMFTYFMRANEQASANNITAYDENIDWLWLNIVRAYLNGEVSKSEALEYFRQNVYDVTNIK